MMAVNMILTCVIFFTFYSSLRKVSVYEAIHQYEQIEASYTDAYFKAMADYKADDEFTTAEQTKTWVETLENLQENDPESNDLKEMELFVTSNEALFVFATDKACEAAKEKWNEVNESWLWVNNIWVADATTRPFQSYDSLKKTADNAGKYYKEYIAKNIDKDEYTIIANYISSSSNVKHNGYYILAILAGVITFAQQLITDFHTKLRNKKANKLAKATNKQNQMSLKIMKIIMPIIMVCFVLTSSASFGIYILASNVAAIAFGEIIALIVNKLTRKQQEAVEEELAKEAERLIKKGQLQE